jgi:hypothetical protein
MTIFQNFGLNHAEGFIDGGQVGGTVCMVYENMPPRCTADLSGL